MSGAHPHGARADGAHQKGTRPPGAHPHGAHPHGARAEPIDPAVAALVASQTPRRDWLGPLLLGLAGTAATAVLLVQLAAGVASVLPPGPRSDGSTALTPSGPAGAVFSPGLAALLLLVAVACTLAADLWVAGGRSAARSRLRTRSAARLGEWNPLLLDRRSVGELVRTVVDASERAAAYRAGFFGPIIAAVAAPVVVLLVMALTVSWPVALILAVLIPLVPLIIVGSQRLFRSASAGYRRSAGQLSGAFYESVQGLGELSLAGAAERRGRTLERLGERNRQQVMRLLAGNQMVILAVELAFGLVVTCAAAGLAAAGLAAGWLDTSQAVAVVLLSVLMTGPVSVVGQFFYIGVTGRAAERQLAELWAEPTGNAPAGTTRPRTEQRGRADQPEPGTDARPGTHREAAALEFRDVTAGYPGGPPVLAGFDLRLGRGERLALRGPSGSGKSTVLALAEKLITPRAGSVLIDGVDLATLSRPEVASRMAIVSQSTTLFSGSIADNLRLAAPDADDSRLWDALAAARLADEVRGFEHGLDQPVGERGLALSGGQAQRISIARALLRDAPLLLLDEPTSQVDLRSEAAIGRSLAELASGRSTLIVTHRPGVLGAGTRTVHLGADADADADGGGA